MATDSPDPQSQSNCNTVVWQLNLRKSRECFDLVLLAMTSSSISFLLISDPPLSLAEGRFSVPGYKIIRPACPPAEVKAMILIREDIYFVEIVSKSPRNAGAVITLGNMSVGLFATYIQPLTADGLDDLQTIVYQSYGRCCSHLLIGGDFNARSHWWGPPHTVTNQIGRKVIEWIDARGLEILNKFPCEPTYISDTGHQSYIDLTIVDQELARKVSSWRVISQGSRLTDHNLVEAEFGDYKSPSKTEPSANWRRADWDKIIPSVKAAISEKGWLSIDWLEEASDVNEVVDKLESDIREAALPFVPVTRRTTNRKSWWSAELSTQHRRTKRCFRRFEKHRLREDAQELKQVAHFERSKLRKMILEAKKTAWRQFVEDSTSTDLWDAFKKIVKAKPLQDVTYLTLPDGNLVDAPDQMIEALSRKFFPVPRRDPYTEAAEPPQTSSFPDSQHPDSHKTQQFPEISLEEVRKAVMRGKPLGATGLDGLPNLLLRKCFDPLGPVLVGIFNLVLRNSSFPKNWKRSKTLALPKGNNPNNELQKFRPISLLPSTGKVLECILAERLTAFLEDNDKLNEHQHGFRRGKSTTTAIMEAFSTIERNIDNRRFTYGISIDIQAAFDSVSHNRLIAAAVNKGVPAYLTKSIQSFLLNRSAMLTAKGVTREVQVDYGTPQGSPWSPILFALIMDSIISAGQAAENCNVQAYADDLLVLCDGESEEEAQRNLQRALDIVTTEIKAQDFKINAQKSQTIRFQHRFNARPMLPVTIDDTPVAEVKSMKYLGIMLDGKLSLKDHVQYSTRKAMDRLALIKRMSKVYWGAAPEVLRTLVTRVIEPMIYYAAPCLSKLCTKFSHLLPFQRVVRKCGLLVSGAFRTTANNSLHLLTGLLSPDMAIGSRILSYARLISGQQGSCLWLTQSSEETRTHLPRSFVDAARYELKRSEREAGAKDLLKVSPILLRNLRPEQMNLLISALPTSETLDCNFALIYVQSKLSESNLTWSGGYLQGNVTSEISGSSDRNVDKTEVEILAIEELLRLLASADPVPQKVCIISNSKRCFDELTAMKNIKISASRIQKWVASHIQNGNKIHWCPAYSPAAETDYCKELIRRSSDNIISLYGQDHRLPDVGWDSKAFRAWCLKSINGRMHNAILNSNTGRFLTDTGVKFSCCSSWSDALPRRDASRLSQLLSGHLPTMEYFSRFGIIDENADLSCACGSNIESRDHLLFDCHCLRDTRMQIRNQLGLSATKELTWESLLNNRSAIVNFLSGLAKHWLAQGRNWNYSNICNHTFDPVRSDRYSAEARVSVYAS